MAVTDIHLEMLDDAIGELGKALDELGRRADAGNLDGVSALAQAGSDTRESPDGRQALASPPVLGLQAERHGGDTMMHI